MAYRLTYTHMGIYGIKFGNIRSYLDWESNSHIMCLSGEDLE
jgi:CMP-2-keto-3-deoxyoctulosonic acid synthetase